MTESEWFAQPEVTCASHPGRPASLVCERCGRFVCADCPHEQTHCAACTALRSHEALRAISRGIAWKLAFLPALVLFSVVTMGLRARSPEVLGAQAFPFAPWLVPLVCGVWLLVRPSVSAAFCGAISGLAMLAWSLAPSLLDGASLARWLEVALLAAAPVAAVFGTLKLAQAEARVRFWQSLGSV